MAESTSMAREPRLPVRRQAVPVRDPRYRPRQRTRTVVDPRATFAGLGLLVLLVGVPLFVVNALGSTAPPSLPGATGTVAAATGSAGASTGTGPTGSPGSAPPSVTAAPPVEIAIVPVVSFWSPQRAIAPEELRAALSGTSETYGDVIVPAADASAIATAAGVPLGAGVRTGTAPEIRAAARDGGLGFMRAADVTPIVRALAIGDRALYGVSRVESLADWPLRIMVTDGSTATDPTTTFTLVAAGDILLDRGVSHQVRILGKGVDFPFDGGTAEITRTYCCHPVYDTPRPEWRRTGNEGAMRELLSSADLALANLESPIDDDFVHHTRGTVFTGDPEMLDGIQRAGIDFLSLGNNHIGDAGRDGVLETIEGLEARDIAYSGAGQTPEGASRPAILETHGVTIAVLGCDAIAATYWVEDRPDSVGSAPCDTEEVAGNVAAVRDDADLVIVFPHWGREYNAEPTQVQRDQAAAWVEAGADAIIGAHSHWAGGMELIESRLAFYSLGNFVFDQTWSVRTMQGLVVELTWDGRRLRQAWLHPTLLIDQSQPNFLDPAGDGAEVLEQVREASPHLPY